MASPARGRWRRSAARGSSRIEQQPTTCLLPPDPIAASVDGYVARAVRLGTDPEARADLVSRLRAASPRIFESTAAVEQLETFFASKLSNG